MSSRQIEAGGAFVRLYTKDGALNKGMTRAENRLRKFSLVATQVGSVMAGTFVAAAAAFTPAIRAASNLEENVNKFNVVFGESRNEIRKWSQQFGDDIGRSERQIVEFMSSSQDLFKPLGFASDEAADLSKEITKLSIDLASFNNMVDEDTLRDLHAALTGSGEVMKKYGVTLSEAAVKQELFNMGLDPKTVDDRAKVQARLNIILAKTTDAQGDAERSAGSYANQMKALEGEIENVQAEFGTALLPTLADLVGEVAENSKAFREWASENPETIRTIADLTVKAGILGGGLIALGAAAKAASVGLYTLNTTAIVTGKNIALISKLLILLGAYFALRHFHKESDDVKAYNEAMKEGIDLTDKMIKLKEKQTNQRVDNANDIQDPVLKKMFLEGEAERLKRDIAGKVASIKGSQRRVDQLSGADTSHRDNFAIKGGAKILGTARWAADAAFGGSSILGEARQEVKEQQQQKEALEQQLEKVQSTLKAVQLPAKGVKPEKKTLTEDQINTDKTNPLADFIRGGHKATKLYPVNQTLEGLQGLINAPGQIFKSFIEANQATEKTPQAVEKSLYRLSANQALDAGTGEAQRVIVQALAPRVTIEEKALKVQEDIRESSQSSETLLGQLISVLEDNDFTLIARKA